MAASGQSLMPEGIEKDLDPARPGRPDRLPRGTGPPPPKTFAGEPARRVVRPGADGAIVLPAAAAEIYGDYARLSSASTATSATGRPTNDRAAWRFEVAQAGPCIAVWLDWACDDASRRPASARGPLRRRQSLTYRGRRRPAAWDRYRTRRRSAELHPPAGPRLASTSAPPAATELRER